MQKKTPASSKKFQVSDGLILLLDAGLVANPLPLRNRVFEEHTVCRAQIDIEIM
jgi:hypothetical protein